MWNNLKARRFFYVNFLETIKNYTKFKSVSTNSKIKKFEDIPGPKGPLGLGNFINYLPLIGRYSWTKLHEASFDKFKKYGSIVKETMVPGVNIVWLYDPSDIAIVLNDHNNKDFPQRRSHLALEKYRIDRPHVYKSAGLIPTNGPEWWRLRSELQKELSSPKNVRSFLPDVDNITTEFCDQLPVNEVFDILPELTRLNLELICLLTFDVRLDGFSEYERRPNSRTTKLMHAAETTNSCILPTDQGIQLWRYFETPTYRRLRKAQNYMENVAVELVSQKIIYFKEELDDSINATTTKEKTTTTTTANNQQNHISRSSLLEEYLKNPNLDLSDIVGMAADLILAGIDTTSYTSGFAFYHLAKNQDVQENLFQESKQVLSNKTDFITTEILNSKIPYTRAFLKENFRMNPISVGVGRILNTDLVLGGYHVPKNSIVVTQNLVACRLSQHFQDPNKFIPERWLNRKNSINPYLVLPFGHGMRACIARRMAEQNMLVLLLRIIRNYHIEWMGSDQMDITTLLINKPDQPVNIRLIPRES